MMYTRTSFGSEVKLASFATPWTRAERLGITCGRRAGSELELQQALKANGLAPGSREWSEAMRTGREAMKLTAEKEACTMMVQGKDGEFRLDEDYRAAAVMDVEQL